MSYIASTWNFNRQMSLRAIDLCVCFEPTKALKMCTFFLDMFFQLYPLVWSNIFLWWRSLKNALPAAREFVRCGRELGNAAGMSRSSPRERAGRACQVLPKMQCFSAASPLYDVGESCLGKSCSWSHPRPGFVLRSHPALLDSRVVFSLAQLKPLPALCSPATFS